MTKSLDKIQIPYQDLQMIDTPYINEFFEFCEHSASPLIMRKYKDDKSFSRAKHISHNTLCNWKKTKEFAWNIRIICHTLLKATLPDALSKLQHKALKEGETKSLEMYLKILGELQDNATIHADNITISWLDNNKN